MTPGTVSVLIPAYNAARYLPEALDCALGQTLPPHEVLVIDDGSKDETPVVCERYAGRIRYVRQENRGEAGARNTGLALATGEFVALLDADDLSTPDRFARQVEALRSNPDAVACFCGHRVFTDQETTGRYPGNPAHAEQPPLEFAVRLLAHPITMMFRRLAADGLQFPDRVKGTDMLFSALLRRRGRFVILPDVLFGYRRHEEQITAASGWTDLASLKDKLDWVRTNGPRAWPEMTSEAFEARIWQAQAEALRQHYWARRRPEFFHLRSALRQHWPPHLPRPAELDLRWYPDWLWGLKNRIDRLRGGKSPLPARTG